MYFDIQMEPGQLLKLTKFISVEYLDLGEFSEHMSQTKFGQLIQGTDYGNYAINNQFLLDKNDFVSKLPPEAKYCCTFLLSGKEIGFYLSPNEGYYYLSQKVDKTCKRIYALKLDEHTEYTQLALRNNLYIVTAIQSFSNGTLRFGNITIKNLVTPIFKKLL